MLYFIMFWSGIEEDLVEYSQGNICGVLVKSLQYRLSYLPAVDI